jgi:hypothetical protein
VTVLEHIYGIPSEDELAMLVGAAVPHFAPQIRGRIAEYAAALPVDHPRQPELARQLARMDELAEDGQPGDGPLDLPPRASLVPPATAPD